MISFTIITTLLTVLMLAVLELNKNSLWGFVLLGLMAVAFVLLFKGVLLHRRPYIKLLGYLGYVALFFGVVLVYVAAGFVRDDDASTGIMSVCLALLCFLPVYRTVKDWLARRQARLLANCFAGVEEPTLRLDALRGRVPIKDPASAISALIAGGYLRNCTVDLGKNAVLLHGPSRVPEEGDFAAVECPGCGATVTVQRGRAAQCAFCGTALNFPGEKKAPEGAKPKIENRGKVR